MIQEVNYIHDITDLFSLFSHEPYAVLLDSCNLNTLSARFDIMAVRPKTIISSFAHHSLIIDRAGEQSISIVPPLELLRHLLKNNTSISTELPFTGGALGFFSYDFGRNFESIPTLAEDDCNLPLMQVGIYETIVVVDHLKKQTWFISEEYKTFSSFVDSQTKIEPQKFSLTSNFRANLSKDSYTKAYAKIKNHLYEGNCYQINLTQRFDATYIGDTFTAYKNLRQQTPSPYSAYLNFSPTTIMSFSPEQFLACKDLEVTTKPIKGTRPRHRDPSLDQKLKDELINSEKDKAENLMIVDLLRNDLGRVCQYGSITVPELFSLESYYNVHHLVSTIKGKLKPELTSLDLLKATFPGGSITGTPKIRAMEIIEEIEPHRRNIYCGSIGYINFNGDMDLNIAIRTLFTHRERIFCAAGGAIVIDSDVDDEYQESLTKIQRLLSILEAMNH